MNSYGESGSQRSGSGPVGMVWAPPLFLERALWSANFRAARARRFGGGLHRRAFLHMAVVRLKHHEQARDSLIEAFWETYAHGPFIPEYCLFRVLLAADGKVVDAVILPDEPHHRAKATDYPSLAGRNVIVVQTKRGRMGMYLMGQALFSAHSPLRAEQLQSVRCYSATSPTAY